MALFGLKKDKVEKKEVAKTTPAKASAKKVVKAKKVAPVSTSVSTGGPSVAVRTDVILRPRITEKAGALSQMGVYTFEVTKYANKAMISSAIVSLYKVTPTNIAIINLPAKKVLIRGRRGVVAGTRKALVTLKKGDKIDFV
jgi:large subunit ribosomal protein L23